MHQTSHANAVRSHARAHVFCDFDGTIAHGDLGDEVFIHFVGRTAFDEYQHLLKTRTIDVKTYWRELCAKLPATLSREAMHEFALTFSLDAGLVRLMDFCASHDVEFTIVSDGFAEYILPLLSRENVDTSRVRVFCNRLEFHDSIHENGKHITPHFAYPAEACSCFCASCKRNALLSTAAPDSAIIYIGDGYSDFCAAEHADYVFAKSSLAAHCNANNIPHFQFRSMDDVRHVLQKLFTQKRLKPRREAAMRRKEAIEAE